VLLVTTPKVGWNEGICLTLEMSGVCKLGKKSTCVLLEGKTEAVAELLLVSLVEPPHAVKKTKLLR
jgi:hypothetical protein